MTPAFGNPVNPEVGHLTVTRVSGLPGHAGELPPVVTRCQMVSDADYCLGA